MTADAGDALVTLTITRHEIDVLFTALALQCRQLQALGDSQRLRMYERIEAQGYEQHVSDLMRRIMRLGAEHDARVAAAAAAAGEVS